MKNLDVINQLFNRLPRYTDVFTDNIPVISLTRSDSTVTAICSAEHGLNTGDYAFINGAKSPVSITSLTQERGIATAETATDTHLTFSQAEFDIGSYSYVDISSANENQYNGNHKLLGVESSRKFSYELEDASAPTPATGAPLLLEELGYNGWHKITRIDPFTFTYQIDELSNSPAVGTIQARINPRISGGVDFQVIHDAFVEKNVDKPWVFSILGDWSPSRNRANVTDAVGTPGIGANYEQSIVQVFTLFAFFKTGGSFTAANIALNIAGRAEQDLAISLTPAFYKSLLGLRLPSEFTRNPYSGVLPTTSGLALYNNSLYVHQYSFQILYQIYYGDTYDREPSWKIKEIDLNFESTLSTVQETIMTAKIDISGDIP